MPRKQGRKGEEEKEGHRVPAAPSLPSRSQTAANLPETTTKGSVTWLCRKAVLAAADTEDQVWTRETGKQSKPLAESVTRVFARDGLLCLLLVPVTLARSDTLLSRGGKPGLASPSPPVESLRQRQHSHESRGPDGRAAARRRCAPLHGHRKLERLRYATPAPLPRYREGARGL
jgi:hypothetical protein